jgi:thiol-disulfide isomerase/thioredoxin
MNPLRPLVVGATALMCSLAASNPPRPVDVSDIKAIITHQRGKVVLLNFWATWCPPCTREFPDLVEIEQQYRNQGLVVVSVSADSPEKVDSDLVPFLEKYRPGFEVYFIRTQDLGQFFRLIDPQWKGTIPATFFFDREGNTSVKRYSEMTRGEMGRIVDALLDEPVP